MTETRFVMVSEWMEKGNINEFVKRNAEMNRLGLVRLSLTVLIFARC